jgi:hypothetical protein
MVLTLYPDGHVRTAVAEVVDPGEFEIDVELIILVPYGLVGRSGSGYRRWYERSDISDRARERSLIGTPAVARNAIAISCVQQVFDAASLCRERAGLINAQHGERCGKRACWCS